MITKRVKEKEETEALPTTQLEILQEDRSRQEPRKGTIKETIAIRSNEQQSLQSSNLKRFDRKNKAGLARAAVATLAIAAQVADA